MGLTRRVLIAVSLIASLARSEAVSGATIQAAGTSSVAVVGDIQFGDAAKLTAVLDQFGAIAVSVLRCF